MEVLRASLGLGLTSFGGPIAHIGYFRREYVERRRWLDETTYADLVALSQLLPGPASSQLGILIGTRRAGMMGGIVAWLGFTLPSASVLVLFGLLTQTVDLSAAGWVAGLKIAAVSIVAQAVYAMARVLTPDLPRLAIAVLAAVGVLSVTVPAAQVAIVIGGAMVGRILLPPPTVGPTEPRTSPISRRVGIICLVAFFGLLLGLPILQVIGDDGVLRTFDAFYRSGSLVFGGGHVVLPLLHAEVVGPGWVSNDQFLAGYGAAQAVPGPLFTFAAYLGAVSSAPPNGWFGAAIALVAIFLPSFLLVFGAVPFWDRLREWPAFRRALLGANAAVVGILAAALYTPIWTSAISAPIDAALAALALALLVWARAAPVLVVALCAVAGQLIGR
ncbi:MAG: chromate efflux transporter [Candidatus Limnocylindrales bacterium]